MPRIHTVLIITFLFLYASVFAQVSEQSLAVISIGDAPDAEFVDQLSLPIYHQSEDDLVVSLTEVQYQSLLDAKISVEIIDEAPLSQSYYLLTKKNGTAWDIPRKWGITLYHTSNTAILETAAIDVAAALAEGYQIAELKKQHYSFKKEKRTITRIPSVISFSDIDNVISEINPDSVQYVIQSLQDFGTRFLFAQTRDSVAEWIKHRFLSVGFSDVQIDSFRYNTTWQKNVVATLHGALTPNEVYVVGGHHDSYSSGDPMIFAPGADDNASGTAAVLEIGRALIAAGVQPEATIKFVTFAAEEYGLHGSYDFAQKASTSGMDIRLMINHDMISHTLGTPGNWEVDLNAYIGFEYFRELARDLILQYTNLLPRNGSMNSGGSDSYSFYSFGFPAFYFEEHDFSPYYHSPQDIISNYDMDFCAEVIKASAALLVYSTEYPQAVQDYQIVDRGNGNSLRLTWTSNPEPDIAGYYIYLGTTAGHYDTSFTATSAPYQINQLTTGVEYFIGISAFDTDGNESMVVEKSAVPRVIPQSPTNVYDEPALQQITIHWSSNDEYDILGYNLYRSEAPGGTPVQLNTTVIEDTFFIDATTQNGVYYYYTATAVDSALNESDPSPEIRSRAVSLDQGILVVDETADGDGSLFNPTDQEVDDFYRQLLDDFQVTEYDVAAEGGVKLADLGAFSSVVWHGNDFSDLSAPYQNLEAIKEYLDFGGNLLISSYFPSQAFADNSSYPADFLPGDFMYDYLKINHVDYSIPARFFGAASLIGNYDSVYVDTIKTAAIPDLHLFKIESISASGEGTEIFSYDSQYPPSNPKGSMNGMPVGVEYIGTDFKTITLSYPLFYINPIQAQDLVTEVMLNKFSEPTPISQKQQQTPGKFSLEQNYPNPFNPTTTIRYNLAEATAVVLKIYNILGQEVLTLINEKQTAGEKSIVWNGRNRFGQKVSSGIYIYQLQAGEYLQSRKMVLLR